MRRTRAVDWHWQAADGRLGKARFGGEKVGKNPTDRGKKGSKESALVDGAGGPLAVVLPAANVHAAFYLPTHAPIVGNVAALVPHKGQRHLIEAAHLVVQEVPDARFIILGEGELRERGRRGQTGAAGRGEERDRHEARDD